MATVYRNTDCFAYSASAFHLISRTHPKLLHLFGLWWRDRLWTHTVQTSQTRFPLISTLRSFKVGKTILIHIFSHHHMYILHQHLQDSWIAKFASASLLENRRNSNNWRGHATRVPVFKYKYYTQK